MDVLMSNRAAIEAARRGERARTHHSIVAEEDEAASATCDHRWRTIACDGDTDVVECARCGQQKLAACDFDDEFA